MQLFVIGMHRSGTSAVARILNMMGAYFGEEGMAMPPSQDNPKGYWERKDIVQLNEKLLHTAQSSWCQVAGFSADDIPESIHKEFKRDAEKILLELDAHRPWVVKDPRFCLVFPLWRSLLDVPVCVFVYRSPIEVAQSLSERDGYPCTETSIPLNAGIALWEKYNIAALDSIKGIPTVFISHRSLMQDPVKSVEKLYNKLLSLKIQGICMPEEKEILSFIDSSLYRQRDDGSVEKDFLNQQQVTLLKLLKEEVVPVYPLHLSDGARSDLYFLEKQSILEQDKQHLIACVHDLERKLTNIQNDYEEFSEVVLQVNTQLNNDLIAKQQQIHELIAYFETLHHYFEIIFDSIIWKIGFIAGQIIRNPIRRSPIILLRDHVTELAKNYCGRKEEYIAPLQNGQPSLLAVIPPKKIKLAEFYPPVRANKDFTVSVVIPTLNARNDFVTLLPMLKRQEGIKSLEVIIVDSGSTDNTVEMAKGYDCIVVQITQEQFSHSYARNLGIEMATGKYTLVMTQDALPPTSYWLLEMLNGLLKNNAVAISCSECPREDADLFHIISSWNHVRFLEVDKGDRVMTLPDSQDYTSLRKNSQLSDIACLMQTDVIKKYKYRNSYAEDLDLGLRLIYDGYTIVFLNSTKIIHSHNRPAYYYLKRAYVDSLTLKKIFQDFPMPSIGIDKLLPDILFTYQMLTSLLCENIKSISFPCSIETLLQTFCNNLGSTLDKEFTPQIRLQKNNYLDDNFFNFIQKISEIEGVPKKKKYDGALIPALLCYMETAFEFFENTYELIDEQLCDEFIDCIYKSFAFQVGAHISSCNQNKLDGKLKNIRLIFTELAKGI